MNKGLNPCRQTGPHLEWKALMICYGINNSFPELFLLSRSRCASAPFSNEKRVGSLMWISPDRIHWNSSAVLLVRSSWVVRTFQRSPPINVSINIWDRFSQDHRLPSQRIRQFLQSWSHGNYPSRFGPLIHKRHQRLYRQ